MILERLAFVLVACGQASSKLIGNLLREEDRMIKRVEEMPVVLTCFAYRQEYFAEMEGMLESIRLHHPQWPVVVGRGPLPGYSLPTLEVDSPSGKSLWTLPVALDLDGSENDWRKITRMKGWWMSRVWHEYGELAEGGRRRLIWLDADARLNGPLDIVLEPDAELIAGPWWYDPEDSNHDTICSGILLFQGGRHGIIESIIDQWSNACQSHIQDLRSPTVPWLDGDQEVLTEVMQSFPASDAQYVLLKLEHDKYAACVNRDGTTLPGALVDQWQMSRKMKFPECRDRNWPPPEEFRRSFAKKS
jgi:hypothetical protein